MRRDRKSNGRLVWSFDKQQFYCLQLMTTLLFGGLSGVEAEPLITHKNH